MIKQQTVLILSFIFISSYCLDYNEHHTLHCSDIVNQDIKSNLELLWNILILHIFDRYMFLALTPIIVIIQVLFIRVYSINSYLLNKPGNIFFALLIIDLILNFVNFSTAVYKTIYDTNLPMPASFVDFCTITAFISCFFYILHFFYLCMFFVYTIFLFRFTLRKVSNIFWISLHLFSIVICFTATIVFYFQQFIGLNFYGICGITPTRGTSTNIAFPTLELIISVIFFLIGCFTYYYFKKHIPSASVFRRRKYNESKIIASYVGGFSICLFCRSIIDMLLNLNCIRHTPIVGITVSTTIYNVVQTLEFILLIVLILLQDNFFRQLKRYLKQLFQRKSQRTSSFTTIKTNEEREIQMENLAFDQNLLTTKQKKNQIDLLVASQIYTIISGVYIANFQYNNLDITVRNIRPIHFQENISFQIQNKSILNSDGQQFRILIKLEVLTCKMVLHAPRVFRKLLEMDGISDVFVSFNLIDNVKKIWNLAQADGGRSGQFFFFSADNKFVLKTITIEQFQFLHKNISFFFEYYKQNPKTLLAKIYGLYTLSGNQMQRTYRIILMKNIIGCQKSQVIRTFDMKGSKYDRQVIKNQNQQQLLGKKTLKDIDFMNYQGQLHMDAQVLDEVKEILKKDCKFLKQFNLLDYSLFVTRVKWKQQPENPQFWQKLQRIKNSSQDNQFYHLAIIDYMQKWDFQKKGEQWWKNLLGKKDVSAAQPNVYLKRFLQFIDQITTILPKSNKQLQEQEIISKLSHNSNKSNSVYGQKQPSQQIRQNLMVLKVPQHKIIHKQKKTNDSDYMNKN